MPVKNKLPPDLEKKLLKELTLLRDGSLVVGEVEESLHNDGLRELPSDTLKTILKNVASLQLSPENAVSCIQDILTGNMQPIHTGA